MECDRIAELLPSYLDGELADAEKAGIEAHLRSCRECAALSALLAETDAALAAFPAVEPGPELRSRLAAIAERKPRFSLFAALRQPRFQPVLAAASLLGIVVSFYLLNPNRREFDKSIVRAFHRGVGKIETLYHRAAGGPEAIGDYAENVYASIQAIKSPDRDKKL
jgi:anti-sigma factor RsiW